MSGIHVLTLILISLCFGLASCLIRPRLTPSRKLYWKETHSRTRLTPISETSTGRYSVFGLVGPKESRAAPIPAYSFVTNSIGPKPPPGYHFSAGPKPTRRPQQVTRQELTQTPARRVDYAARQQTKRREKVRTEHQKTSQVPGSPAVCGASCPEYAVLSRHARYEVRRYPTTVWLSYLASTGNRLLAEMEAADGIQSYRDGNNLLGRRLPETFPVLTQMRFSPAALRGRPDVADFTVSLPLLGDNVHPRPLSNQLVLDSVGQQTVYVMPFRARPWRLTERSLRTRARRLSRRLRRRGDTYLRSFFYLAKYQGPDSDQRTYYELWFYSTPQGSRHRFRPLGKPLRRAPSAATNHTRLRLCRGFECPRFEVLAEYEGGVQKRHYYNAAFATSRLDRCETELGTLWRSIEPLHLYRQGVNTHLEVIEPTRPAAVLRFWEADAVDADVSGNETCRMTSMVYLPRRLHRSPPNSAPHAAAIGLSYIHELTVYALPVSGSELESLQGHLSAFRRWLDRLQLCYRTNEHFLAVYEPPSRRHGRLNELWMVAQRCA